MNEITFNLLFTITLDTTEYEGNLTREQIIEKYIQDLKYPKFELSNNSEIGEVFTTGIEFSHYINEQ